jgi:hypothetical protein
MHVACRHRVVAPLLRTDALRPGVDRLCRKARIWNRFDDRIGGAGSDIGRIGPRTGLLGSEDAKRDPIFRRPSSRRGDRALRRHSSKTEDKVERHATAPRILPVPSARWHATELCPNSLRPSTRSATRHGGHGDTATGAAIVMRAGQSAEPCASGCSAVDREQQPAVSLA